MRFYVSRHGSNAVNQSMTPVLCIAEVEASSAEEACRLAEQRVTVYNNQHLSAQPAEEIDAQQAEIDRRVTVL